MISVNAKIVFDWKYKQVRLFLSWGDERNLFWDIFGTENELRSDGRIGEYLKFTIKHS